MLRAEYPEAITYLLEQYDRVEAEKRVCPI